MIGRVRRLSRREIHIGSPALHGERCSRQDLVDAPALVRLHGAGLPIIPEGVLLAIRMELAEDVCKAPRDRLLVCAADRFVETDMGEVLFGVMDIQRLRRHVQVPAPDRRLGWGQVPREVGT